MKYFIRTLKYFVYCAAFLTLVLAVMAAAGLIEWNVDTMFQEGTRSLFKIALALAAISAAYPAFGFQRRKAIVNGSYAERRGEILAVFEERGYVLESESEEGATFRRKGFLQRLFRMFEDRITLTQEFGGFELEGLRKDVVPLVMRLEYRLSDE
ncbi:MAG: hypothetical protein J6Y32_00460 [Bacteroidales bacterium]|nr:hypothetical protein [Bacteroidales bacterium]